MQPSVSRRSRTQLVANLLANGLQSELELTPKPGLVDRWDNGSHPDLSYGIMEQSVELVRDYLLESAEALDRGTRLEVLRHLGRGAEQRMEERFGTNTHRGAIFLGGLLLAAFHRASSGRAASWSDAARVCAAELFKTSTPMGTVGARTRSRYQASGIIGEALRGLPAVFRVCVPALERAEVHRRTADVSMNLALAHLMMSVEDTTTLRRGGHSGLNRVKADGAALAALLARRADPQAFLIRTNAVYRRRALTMGGIADLLGTGIGVRAAMRTMETSNATWQELRGQRKAVPGLNP